MDAINRFADGDYRTLDTAIKQVMRRSAGDAVLLGYLLRRMMDEKLWTRQYSSLDGYLREELHMDYTMACRFEAINRKYSVGGHSKDIDAKWEGYSQGVLIEMLNMPPELEEKITPDMSVRQVREEKRKAREKKAKGTAENQAAAKNLQEPVNDPPQEMPEGSIRNESESDGKAGVFPGKDEVPDAEYRELDAMEEAAVPQCSGQEETEKVATSQPEKSAYGLEKTVYPEGSLIVSQGCGTHYCFTCAQDCGIRQKFRYCRYAPLGNPFGCATMESIEELRADVRDRCQFVNNDLARHSAGTNEAEPCCMDCKEDCGYRCRRSCQNKVTDLSEAGSNSVQEVIQDDGITNELAEIKHILKKEQKTLDDYLEVVASEKLPEKLMFRQKTIVAALAAMVSTLENTESEAEPEKEVAAQPELPKFKNNNQRKDWLKAYKDWGLWYQDENIGAKYYKYDFSNGARLIAEVYQEEATKYHDAYESCFLHLVGGPKPPEDQHRISKWSWHKSYSRYPNSETELVEFLKEVQRNE